MRTREPRLFSYRKACRLERVGCWHPWSLEAGSVSAFPAEHAALFFVELVNILTGDPDVSLLRWAELRLGRGKM